MTNWCTKSRNFSREKKDFTSRQHLYTFFCRFKHVLIFLLIHFGMIYNTTIICFFPKRSYRGDMMVLSTFLEHGKTTNMVSGTRLMNIGLVLFFSHISIQKYSTAPSRLTIYFNPDVPLST